MKMNNKVTFYIPSVDKNGNAISTTLRNDMIKNIRVFCSTRFGGWSEYDGQGGYIIDETKQLIIDNIKYIYSYTDFDTIQKALFFVISQARFLCKIMQQDCVSLEINNQLFLINEKTTINEIKNNIVIND